MRAGALILRRALPYFPPGVHLAVVDPEVGGERRAVAVRTAEEDRILVGPDNGLLALAAARFGGVVEAVDWPLAPPPRAGVGDLPRTRPVRPGRRSAGGRRAARGGRRADRSRRWSPRAAAGRAEGGDVVAHALAFDRFGNVMLDVEHESSPAWA